MSRHHRHKRREQPRASDTARAPIAELLELSPFSVFCALWLGVTAHDGFALAGSDAVAARFGLGRDELEAFLREHGLRAEDLRRARFDLESARLDIRVAPDGISRVELARPLFAELCALLAERAPA